MDYVTVASSQLALGVPLHVGRVDFVRPVEKSLPDDGGNSLIIEASVLAQHLVHQRALPATLHARHAVPAADLTSVVLGPAAKVKTGVPLKEGGGGWRARSASEAFVMLGT